MFLFLTVVQALVAAALIGVILMQKSEGGGLGIGGGGSPGGMMSARSAADFLTRATRWLALAFVVLSIILAALAIDVTGGDAIETTLERERASTVAPDPLAEEGAVAPAPADGAADPLAETDPLAAPAE